MTDHITSDEIFEPPEEIIELLRANAEQHRESSPCFYGLLMRAADAIEHMIAAYKKVGSKFEWRK